MDFGSNIVIFNFGSKPWLNYNSDNNEDDGLLNKHCTNIIRV